MRVFALTVCVTLATLTNARPQHKQVDPGYLRQYYAQIAQTAGEQSAAQGQTAPIYEQQEGQQRQYAQERQYAAQPQQQQQIQYVQQPQPQQQVYRAPHLQQQKQAPRPKPVAQKQQYKEDPEEYEPPASYQFGFDVKDDEFTNYQNRKESSENGVIKGSYSVVDADGFIRTVTYTADPKEGFKAEVVREPTDIVIKMPKPQQQQEEPKGVQQIRHQPQQYIQSSPASRYQQPQQQQQQHHQQQQHQQQQQQRPEYQYQQ